MPVYSWLLAWRYLVTRRVTLLGVIGVAVAVWAMIVVIAVFSGFIGEIRGAARLASPDLLLTGVRADCDFAAVAPVLRADPDVVAIAPRVQHEVILAAYGLHGRYVPRTRAVETTALERQFVRLLGVDPAAEREATAFERWLTGLKDDDRRLAVEDAGAPFAVSPERMRSARRLTSADPRVPAVGRLDGILLSAYRLTRGEPIEPGSRIDVISGRFVRGEDGGTEVGVVRLPAVLSGAFACGHRTFDHLYAIADIEFVRRLLGHAPDESPIELVTQVAIRLRPGADPATVADRLEAAVANVSGGQVLSWEEQNAELLTAVDQERRMTMVCVFVVMLVAAFLIYATLHMTVTQKVHDIGILTALGATPGGVQAIFLLSGLVIAVVGCLLGAASGIAFTVNLNEINAFTRARFGFEFFPSNIYALDHIPYQLDPAWVAQVAGSALVLALVVAWLPARRAARLDPVQALAKG